VRIISELKNIFLDLNILKTCTNLYNHTIWFFEDCKIEKSFFYEILLGNQIKYIVFENILALNIFQLSQNSWTKNLSSPEFFYVGQSRFKPPRRVALTSL
jgi:hypothetical protein